MKLKALVAALGLFTMAGASANDLVLPFGNVGNAPGGVYFAKDSVTHEPGSFEDRLTFSVLSPVYDQWIGGGTIADQPKVDGSNIDSLNVDLFYTASLGGTYAHYAHIGSSDFYITNKGPLDEGYYYFKVTGTAVGPSSSSYTYSASVQPVPEPESYAMMLAGLGLLGLMARRRLRR